MAASLSVASVSTAAYSNNKQWYEVFINHRGVDTKETFARSLYLRLLKQGIRAFLDKHEMQPGYQISSQIENAIKTASIHVAIFSVRYAESYWCLDELLLMLESKAPIIPVFYGVTPAELRWTQGKDGIYAQALKRLAEKRTHEGNLRYDSNTVEKWRNALSHLAGISGFVLDKCNIGEHEELNLLDEVVKHLGQRMKKEDLHVAKFPTGLDEKLRDFEDTVLLQRQQSGRPKILGIWGLGGVGKTTLAKEFFNRKKSDYGIHCFLSDVGDNAARETLFSLQKILLNRLTGLDKPIQSVAEGTGLLEKGIKHLQSSNASLQHLQSLTGLDKPIDNVLVILDDIHHSSQVDALLPVDLPSGSLVLITSRDKGVLINSKVDESSIYLLSGLNNQHSLELFCSHAFNQTYPLPRFEYLVDKFLEACNRLPLSLKVIGAHLYGRDLSYWEDELECFQQILPSEIKKRLQISYDALDELEKQIFLDVACFFVGENRDTAVSVWNASGWIGRRGFENLRDKCLVEVDDENVIRMHNHLRDLGRNVAEKSSPRRLWRCTNQVIDGLLHESSKGAVRGIRTGHDDEDDVISLADADTENALRKHILRRLQILDTEGERILTLAEPPDILGLRWLRWLPCKERLRTMVEHILRRAKLPCRMRTVELPNILWLRWINCPYSSLPSGISMRNLRCLTVSGSVLKRLQLKNNGVSAQAIKLVSLRVCDCSELEELPSIGTLVSLEELCANRCVKLKNIQGLEQATKLRKLSVRGCSKLEVLSSMKTLLSLEELWTDGCVRLKSIEGLEKATKLRKLIVGGCSELQELPNMETLVSLQELRADGCVKLKSISQLGHLTKLRQLDVSGWCELEELPSMGTLVSLEELWANRCVKLKRIQGLEQATKLRKLSVSGCSELEELASMETLVSLEELWADECAQLKRIRGLEQATKLRKLFVRGCYDIEELLLSVSECSESEELPNMETLVCLEELWASKCVQLKNIRGLEQATKLRKLIIGGCSALEELPSVRAMVDLEELWADGCVQLKSIRGLEHARKLRKLIIGGCSALEELPSVRAMVDLEELWADGCVQLKSIRGLEHARKLRKLIIGGCSALEELPSVRAMVDLEELWADGCVQLKTIKGLEHARKLRKLFVGGCSKLEELPTMETLVCLEELWAGKCVQLKSIRGLEQATKLRKLIIGGCSALEELPSMEAMVDLEELWADKCVHLKSIRGLEQATKLQKLIIGGCSALEELPSMEAMVDLEELWADGCVKLKGIRGLEQARKLRKLFVGGCSELKELPCMETLVCLEELWAGGCVQLKSIRGLEQATKLQKLIIGGCSALEELPSMEAMVDLEELWADGCVKLKSIKGLEQARKLRKLFVGGCSELKELPCMETLVCLEELWAGGCVQLKSIRGLEQATKLQELIIGGCSALEELPSMEAMVDLEELWADGCVKLKSIRGLEQATKLRKLIIRGCSVLEELPNMETLVCLEELWADGCVQLKSIEGWSR